MRRLLIHIVLLLCWLPLTAQDYALLSRTDLLGTARYMAMGGAMTAVGGDPSAVADNPAGLRLYRRTEVQLTVGMSEGGFCVPNLSWVLCLPSSSDKVVCHNLMLSYQRRQQLGRSYAFDLGAGASLSDQLAASVNAGVLDFALPSGAMTRGHFALSEAGSTDEYALTWALNLQDRLYVGVGTQVQAFRMSQDAVYEEYTADGYLLNQTSVLHSGLGISASAGVLWRPIQWVRLGMSLVTPSWGAVVQSAGGCLVSVVGNDSTPSYAPDYQAQLSDYHRPFRMSMAAAFHLYRYGLVSLQYDYASGRDVLPMHTLRAGLELVPVHGLYIQAGYAIESPFCRTYPAIGIDPTLNRQDAYYLYSRTRQYATCGIGYRGTYMLVQAAYRYAWQRSNICTHSNAEPMDALTVKHAVVVSLGWHRN